MTDMPAVLMPDFWPTKAALWFRLLENQLFYCQITDQFTRFATLAPYLTEEVAVQVSDVLIHPSAETPYGNLKNAILRRLQPPKARSATKLLPQQQAIFQSSPPLQAQSSSRPVAVPMTNNLGFHKAQIPAYAFTEEVEFFCVLRLLINHTRIFVILVLIFYCRGEQCYCGNNHKPQAINKFKMF